jgi:hypothetical protein
MLIKKAVAVRKHLSTNRKDKDSKLYVAHAREFSWIAANMFQPPHSHRVPYPPPVPLLQDRRCPPPHLEVRERHRLHHGRISVRRSRVDGRRSRKYPIGVSRARMLYGLPSLVMIWNE